MVADLLVFEQQYSSHMGKITLSLIRKRHRNLDRAQQNASGKVSLGQKVKPYLRPRNIISIMEQGQTIMNAGMILQYKGFTGRANMDRGRRLLQNVTRHITARAARLLMES